MLGEKASDQARVLAARQGTADRGLGGFVEAVDTVIGIAATVARLMYQKRRLPLPFGWRY